ncbi:hypothetical protein HII31_00818, partial [Pseudocercospora fuligena]
MPSSTLSMSDSPSSDIVKALRRLPSWPKPVQRHEQPAASSRGFLRPSVPPRAKGEEIGFLHLPENVRKRIYELAIYDHDRTAVFLPRGLPHLVKHPERLNWDGRTGNAWAWHWTTLYQPVASDDGAAADRWVGPDPDLQVTPFKTLGMSIAAISGWTDENILGLLDDRSEYGDGSSDSGSTTLVERREELLVSSMQSEDASDIIIALADDTDSELEVDRSELEEDPGSDSSLSPAHYRNNYSIFDFESDDPQIALDRDSEESDEPESCDPDSCSDPNCRKCCNLQRYFEGLEDEDRNVFTLEEHNDADDIERYDSEEVIGMLYEREEPGILLACKEVRAQCLPVYYTQNAFSWRFSWTDYRRSCRRFKRWLKSVGPDHVKLITKITFQGRHCVEEGIDFSADIDLLGDYPYFETNIYVDDDGAGLQSASDGMNREMANYLWLMTQYERNRPTFSIGHLCELANMFVQAMHR